jgi:uncharacterized protein (TIGR03083 family)
MSEATTHFDADADVVAFTRATSRFATLLRHTSGGARPVPHLEWSVGELGAHVLSGLVAYADLVTGDQPLSAGLDHLAARNYELLAAVRERHPGRLAEQIDEAAATLLLRVRESPRERVPWQGDIEISPAGLLALSTGELTVHGWDLSRAARTRFGIDRGVALTIIDGLVEIAPQMVDPVAAAGFTGSFDIRLRGGRPVQLVFTDGELQVLPGQTTSRADCHFSVDPAAFVLTCYKRISPTRSAARGSVTAWGRRPWWAYRLGDLMRSV